MMDWKKVLDICTFLGGLSAAVFFLDKLIQLHRRRPLSLYPPWVVNSSRIVCSFCTIIYFAIVDQFSVVGFWSFFSGVFVLSVLVGWKFGKKVRGINDVLNHCVGFLSLGAMGAALIGMAIVAYMTRGFDFFDYDNAASAAYFTSGFVLIVGSFIYGYLLPRIKPEDPYPPDQNLRQ